MEVVVFGTRPEGNDIVQRPGKIYSFHFETFASAFKGWVPTIAAVGVNSLEKTKCNPYVNTDDMQIAREKAIYQGTKDGSSTKNEDLSRMSVLCSQAKGRRIFVVDFVDMLV